MSKRLIVFYAACGVAGVAFGFFGPQGLRDWLAGFPPNLPDVPGPPRWIVRFDSWVLAHALVKLYWLLGITTFLVWIVMHRQRRRGETPAARAFRYFVLTHALVWFALLSARWLFVSWRPFPFVVVSVFAGAATLWVLVALVRTYVFGQGINGPPPIDEEIAPPAYAAAERRSGRERRRNWRPPRIGA